MSVRALGLVAAFTLLACASGQRVESKVESSSSAVAIASAAPTPIRPLAKFKISNVEFATDDALEGADDIAEDEGEHAPSGGAEIVSEDRPTATGAPKPDGKAVPKGGEQGRKGPKSVGAAQTSSGSGQLSRENIEATLSKSEDGFGRCVESSGTFSARVVVAPNGSVSEARVTQSSPDDPRVRDCLTEALRRMSFPPSSAPVPLSFSLAIEPA